MKIFDPKLTGSIEFQSPIIGTLQTTASWAVNVINGASSFPFTGSAIISGSLRVTGSFNLSGSMAVSGALIINSGSIFDATTPAALNVKALSGSHTIAEFYGEIDNYSQIYVKNTFATTNASSDMVAVANNGTENTNYIDVGINSSIFNGFLGGPNDAYVYSTGSNLYIGNLTPNKSIFFFASANTGSNLLVLTSQSVLINQAATNSLAPQSFVVNHSNSSSYNLATGYGNVANYMQYNLQNRSNSTSASTDWVATNDIGTETSFFIDMGINGSNYINNGNGIGTGSDAYLYSTGRSLWIGNGSSANPNTNLYLFAVGTGSGVSPDLFISSSGQIGIGTNATSSFGTYEIKIVGETMHSGSIFVTASEQTNAITSIGNLTVSGSINGTASFNSTAAVLIGNTIITGSLIVSGTSGAGVFSKGGTIADLVNGVNTTGSYNVWRAPFRARVINVYGFKSGSSNLSFNARKSGSSTHLSINGNLAANNQWSTASAVTNTDYAVGDSLEIILTGSFLQASVQVDFIKLV